MAEVATRNGSGAKIPRRPASTITAEGDFLAGRDLAIKLVAEGQTLCALPAANLSEIRALRRGKAQNRFVEPYLRALLAQPSMMHGFAAVLSTVLGSQGNVHFAENFRLPLAEYLPGDVGADGTQTYDDAGFEVDEGTAAATAATPPTEPVHTPAADAGVRELTRLVADFEDLGCMLASLAMSLRVIAVDNLDIEKFEDQQVAAHHQLDILERLSGDVIANAWSAERLVKTLGRAEA